MLLHTCQEWARDLLIRWLTYLWKSFCCYSDLFFSWHLGGLVPLRLRIEDEVVLGNCIAVMEALQYDFGRQYSGPFSGEDER